MRAHMPSARMAHRASRRWLLALAISLLLLSQARPVRAVLPAGVVWEADQASDQVRTYATAADGTLTKLADASAGQTPGGPHHPSQWRVGLWPE